MRIAKLTAVLAVTVILYLVFLYFHLPFGIALVIALAFMWAGVKYVRAHDTETEITGEKSTTEDRTENSSEE